MGKIILETSKDIDNNIIVKCRCDGLSALEMIYAITELTVQAELQIPEQLRPRFRTDLMHIINEHRKRVFINDSNNS